MQDESKILKPEIVNRILNGPRLKKYECPTLGEILDSHNELYKAYEAAKETHQPVITRTCTAPHETEAETLSYMKSFAQQPVELPWDAPLEAIKDGIAEARKLFEESPDDFNSFLSDDDLVAFIFPKIEPYLRKRESVAPFGVDIDDYYNCLAELKKRQWQRIETAPKDGYFSRIFLIVFFPES